MYSQYGLAGFYRGLALSILRAVPSNACAYFVYETLLRTLGAEKVSLDPPHDASMSSHVMQTRT
jgi:solute carrier family 25 carnitine/acylcarnitine transporter 20/29